MGNNVLGSLRRVSQTSASVSADAHSHVWTTALTPVISTGCGVSGSGLGSTAAMLLLLMTFFLFPMATRNEVRCETTSERGA